MQYASPVPANDKRKAKLKVVFHVGMLYAICADRAKVCRKQSFNLFLQHACHASLGGYVVCVGTEQRSQPPTGGNYEHPQDRDQYR